MPRAGICPWANAFQSGLIAACPVTSRNRAAGDVFCYRLPVQDFHALLARSGAFRDFATLRLASLPIESRRAQAADTATGSRQLLERYLREMVPETTVFATADESVRQVLERRRSGRSDSALVADDTGRASGIFTLRDLRDRVALAGTDVALPVGDVMTPDPIGLPAGTMSFEAALTVAEHGFRHVVVTENDRATGCLSESDLFACSGVAFLPSRPDCGRLAIFRTSCGRAGALANLPGNSLCKRCPPSL